MEPPEETPEATTGDPDYYQVLGVAPTADAAAIDAAYQGRTLRFRVGQLRQRTQDLAGPTQEQIEKAYATLGDPESRALYDAVYYPEKAKQPPARRRLPPWIWAVAAAWVVAIVVVACIGVRSKQQSDDGAIGRIVNLTATAPPSLVAAAATPTAPAVVAPIATAVATPSLVATPTTPPPTPTPTATVAPTATATVPPTPTPTVVPTATPVPPTPTPEPPPTEPPPPPPEPPPEPPPPPPPPAFQPTDRIGVSVNVNLRYGPGTNYVSLGPLRPGTLLHATGQTAVVGGQLWRRFMLEDGRVGWVRDIDVLPVR